MPIPENAPPQDYVACQMGMKTGKKHPMTIHDLFNELQRRLFAEAERDNDHDLKNLSDHVDELHHDYTDLTQED